MLKLKSNQQRWWEFLITMVARETRIKYKNTVLGFSWMIINPVVQMLVLGFVFQFVLNTKIENYFLFIFPGLSLWNYFSFTVTRSTSAIVNQRSLIQKASFPREIIILSEVVSNLFPLLLSMSLYLLVLIFGFDIIFPNNWWEIGVVILFILILSSGLSLGLSAINVKYRDVKYIVGAVMPLLFYATPIVYKLQMLPVELSHYLYINPLTGIIEVFRHATLGIEPLSWGLCWLSMSTSIILLFFGWKTFINLSQHFDDWV